MKNRIKELRQIKKVSQGDLAKATGLTRQAISNYENKERIPNKEILEKLADYFDVSVPYLKGEIDTEYLEKLIELALFFCFPEMLLNYGNIELDDDCKSVIVVGILSQILEQLGYEPKGKFKEIYLKAMNLEENQMTRSQLTGFKTVVDKFMPKFQRISSNLLQAYEKL